MSFFLGGMIPSRGKNEEIISERRKQSNSYFCRGFNEGDEEKIEERNLGVS